MSSVKAQKKSRENSRTSFPLEERVSKGLSERVSPHSIDAEQALLASCILEGGQESITTCIEAKLIPDAFFKPAHKILYRVLLDLYEEGIPVDEIILGDRLQGRGLLEEIGGHAYLNEVTNRIDTPAHLPHYLKRVRDTSLLRRVIQSSMKAIERAYHDQDNVDQFLEEVEQEIFKISEARVTDSAKPFRETMEAAVSLVHQMLKSKGMITGVSTGLRDLDRMTFGFQASDMIVIAGRPSTGKTSFATTVIEAAIMGHGKDKKIAPTLFFSLEMSAEQLAMRMLCSHARVDMQKLKDGFLPSGAEANLARSAKEMQKSPLWIDDAGHMTVLEMRAKARRIHAQHKLGLVVIDYLQLVSGMDSRMPREQQIAEISRGIKSMAKELSVPVLVLSQLNRESERENRQPRLSDLRESGSIEQDADLVLMLSRKKVDGGEDGFVPSNIALVDLIVAKQRNGPVGIVTLVYNKNITRFENYTPQSSD